MKISRKMTIMVSFWVVVTISGLVTTVVGVRLIGNYVVKQAQEQVRLDLNSAREIYYQKLKDIQNTVALTSIRDSIKDALSRKAPGILTGRLEEVRKMMRLDILTITDGAGRVVFRSSNPAIAGDSQADDELVSRVLAKRQVVAATEIVSRDKLRREGASLADRAAIKLVYTPKARQSRKSEETSGMMLKAAAPIFNDRGVLIGVLYGGDLINRGYALVDEIRDTVYQDVRYGGRKEGTATIFQGNERVSTNVLDVAGKRAIGTRVSAEVQARVLDKGEDWIGRAFVVNDWCFTAYEPIRNIAGKVIGSLYVGRLERRFVDMQKNATLIFLGITTAGAMLSLLVAYFLANALLKPVRRLVAASHELSRGDFSHRIEPVSNNELGELEKALNFMASCLKDRDDAMREQTQQQMLKSEKLASIGRLAAGVAHQINNPLTGILTYSSVLLKTKAEDDPEREDLEVVVGETMRCREIVKGLLGFSRQTEPQKQAVDINDVIENALCLTKNQALIHNVKVIPELSGQLSQIVVDTSQIQEVFLNIIMNAIDAMPEGGELGVASKRLDDRFIQIRFSDTGGGIPPENLDKLFEPFFTTKDASRGTGLGLAIAYGIIEKHCGKIHMESEPGKGTTCIIDLPVDASE
jgi:two-component system NtrC family sensor kinase